MNPDSNSLIRGRIYLIIASVLWSLSGLFTRLLQKETFLDVHQPSLSGIQIAFFRALFAGLFFIPFIRLRDIRFRPLMPIMIICFASMNALFLSAMAMGSAANAILLQNTAPFWVYLVCVYLLGEKPDRRSLQAILIGMLGMVIIVIDGLGPSSTDQLPIMLMAIGSGITYAAIILFLRALREESSQWLIVQNHLGSAFCLATAMLIILGANEWWKWITTPTWKQLLFLAFFGVVQMGLPYWFFAKGLRTVGPQEAGTITLLEPLLNPFWAFLISPETETPPTTTLVGGSLILAALLWRYAPRRSRTDP
jgi:drug/metabolite transporter, DME family